MSLDDFATSLAHEALSEAAENFFGQRVELDRERERLESKAAELSRLAQQALDRAALLCRLLLDDQGLRDFFRALGLPESAAALFQDHACRPARLQASPPRAITRSGRYRKLLLAAYDQAQRALHEYRRGRLVQEHARAPKRLSLHYDQLRDWCGEFNDKVKATNNSQSASCTINFCRCLASDGMSKEATLGGGVDNFACSLDDSMRLPSLDFASLNLPDLPELPPLDAAAPALEAFASRQHARRGPEIDALLRSLPQP